MLECPGASGARPSHHRHSDLAQFMLLLVKAGDTGQHQIHPVFNQHQHDHPMGIPLTTVQDS